MANISTIDLNGSKFETRPYGTCSTGAGTKAKTVSISDFELYEGASIIVKFANGNTVANPTLNVNGKGAKNIVFDGSQVSNSLYYKWSAGAVLEFIYNDNGWNLLTTTNVDTKNTAGSTNSDNKLFLVGTTSQTDSSQTYSHDTAYVGSDGYLYSNSSKVDMKATRFLTGRGTHIPENADLNDPAYIKVGSYLCYMTSIASTLKNCPTNTAFKMEVLSPYSASYDNEETSTYVTRTRIITTGEGLQYKQRVYSTTVANNFTFNNWQFIPMGSVVIDTTDTNGSNLSVGSTSTPIYINSSGKIKACDSVVAKSVYSATNILSQEELDKFIETGRVKFGTLKQAASLTDPALSGKDGFIMSHSWDNSTTYGTQLAYDESGHNIFHRYKSTNGWSAWKALSFADHTHSYLPLSGGTLSGLLTIKRSPSAIKFNNSSDSPLGYLGINADDDPVVYKADGTTMRHILHSANYSNYALPLTGGTLTGALTISNNPLKITNEKYIVFDNPRYAVNKGTWANTQLTFRGPADSDGNTPNIYSLGAYGHENTLGYVFIGANDYSSTNNLRIYPDGHIRATDFCKINGTKVSYEGHTQDGSTINKLTGYAKATSDLDTDLDILPTDSLNSALGKLEYKADIACDWIDAVTAEDTDDKINKWNEIVDFVDSVKEGTDITEEFVTRKTEQTITGLKSFEASSVDANRVGVALKLKNAEWIANMSTAVDFYNGKQYTVPNARIETLMNGAGGRGGTLIFSTQSLHDTSNPNPNGLTERFRLSDDGVATFNTVVSPKANNTYNLGSSSLKWANVYATTFNGNLTGNATSASILKSLDSGDVVENLNDVLSNGTRAYCYHSGYNSTNGPTAGGYGGVLNVDALYSKFQLFARSNSELYFRQSWSGNSTPLGNWKKLIAYENDADGNITSNISGLYSTVTATTPAKTGWYRIAQSSLGIERCNSSFQINAGVSERHSTITLNAYSSYGYSNSTGINILSSSNYGSFAISKVRIVYNTSYSGNYAYLEVYNPVDKAITITVKQFGGYNWTLLNPSTTGEVPSGYTSKETEIVNDSIISSNFVGNLTGNVTGNVTGNASSANKLSNTTAIGSESEPVYFTANGVPAVCSQAIKTAAIYDKVENRLKTTGWYRIATLNAYGSYLLSISGSYQNINSTAASFIINKSYDKANIQQLSPASVASMITKVRLVNGETTGTKYVEVYNNYTSTVGELFVYRITTLMGLNPTGSDVVIQDPTKVTHSLTVQQELTIATNATDLVPAHTHSYLPLTGGTLTGDLSFNMENVDRFINFNYKGGTTYSWRLGYLGTGEGNTNYFTIQSAKAAGTQWYPVVNFGNETLDANFAGNILPMTTNTKNLGSSNLKWNNVYATTFNGNLTGNANSATYININNSPNNGDFPLTFVSNTTIGNQGLYVSTGKSLTFNPSTGNLKATTFTGNLIGNADTATKASTVAIAANSADVACELWFQDSTRDGGRGKLTYDNDLRYNPNKNKLMLGGMTSSVISPENANITLDGANKKITVGESFIQYNSTTGCLEITA